MRFVSISLFLACIALLAQVHIADGTKLRRHRKRWNEEGEHYPDEHESINEDVAHDDPDDGAGGWHGNDEREATEEPVTQPSPCQFDELVKCLSDPLDVWAITLHSLKENIVSISTDDCLAAREEIRKCIEVKAADLQCVHSNILEVAGRVTDLLVQKKDSGNWLRSYYVTEYVCDEEGKAIRDSIDDACLKQEHIGRMLIEAIEHMDKKLSNNHTAQNRERCDFLRERAHLLRSIAQQKCVNHQPVEAGLLMCETVKTTFLKMHSEMFNNGDHVCQFECKQSGTAAPNGDEGTTETGDAPQTEANNGEGNGEAQENNLGVQTMSNWIHLILASATAVFMHQSQITAI